MRGRRKEERLREREKMHKSGKKSDKKGRQAKREGEIESVQVLNKQRKKERGQS